MQPDDFPPAESLQPQDEAPSGDVLWIVGALAFWGAVAAAVGVWLGAGK